jgi:hypothetical protein
VSARDFFDAVKKHVVPDQLAKAQRLAREWMAKAVLPLITTPSSQRVTV